MLASSESALSVLHAFLSSRASSQFNSDEDDEEEEEDATEKETGTAIQQRKQDRHRLRKSNKSINAPCQD